MQKEHSLLIHVLLWFLLLRLSLAEVKSISENSWNC